MSLKCSECGSTNIFFDYKTQEYECLSCGHKWRKGEERPFGVPKTEEERKATHKERFGTEELPPRGSAQRPK